MAFVDPREPVAFVDPLYAGQSSPTKPNAISSSGGGSGVPVFQLRGLKQQKTDDEWMYAIESGKVFGALYLTPQCNRKRLAALAQ